MRITLYYIMCCCCRNRVDRTSQFGKVKRVLEMSTSAADDAYIQYNIMYKTLRIPNNDNNYCRFRSNRARTVSHVFDLYIYITSVSFPKDQFCYIIVWYALCTIYCIVLLQCIPIEVFGTSCWYIKMRFFFPLEIIQCFRKTIYASIIILCAYWPTQYIYVYVH